MGFRLLANDHNQYIELKNKNPAQLTSPLNVTASLETNRLRKSLRDGKIQQSASSCKGEEGVVLAEESQNSMFYIYSTELLSEWGINGPGH